MISYKNYSPHTPPVSASIGNSVRWRAEIPVKTQATVAHLFPNHSNCQRLTFAMETMKRTHAIKRTRGGMQNGTKDMIEERIPTKTNGSKGGVSCAAGKTGLSTKTINPKSNKKCEGHSRFNLYSLGARRSARLCPPPFQTRIQLDKREKHLGKAIPKETREARDVLVQIHRGCEGPLNIRRFADPYATDSDSSLASPGDCNFRPAPPLRSRNALPENGPKYLSQLAPFSIPERSGSSKSLSLSVV
jgi:hypothetical protein